MQQIHAIICDFEIIRALQVPDETDRLDFIVFAQMWATPRHLDRFPGNLSYSMYLLISFDGVEVNHGWWLPAMDGVGQQVVVECDPVADTGRALGPGFRCVQIDSLILQ
jgi:hypothetical protein